MYICICYRASSRARVLIGRADCLSTHIYVYSYVYTYTCTYTLIGRADRASASRASWNTRIVILQFLRLQNQRGKCASLFGPQIEHIMFPSPLGSGSCRCALIGVPCRLRMLSMLSTFDNMLKLTIAPQAQLAWRHPNNIKQAIHNKQQTHITTTTTTTTYNNDNNTNNDNNDNHHNHHNNNDNNTNTNTNTSTSTNHTTTHVPDQCQIGMGHVAEYSCTVHS